METPEDDPLGGLSDEELGRLVRANVNQTGDIASIKIETEESHESWFQKQLRINHLDRLFDGLQRKVEEDLGIDND